MSDHEFGIVPHDWLRLHMEILQHFVTPPASNEADYISTHSGTEECHGACRLKGRRRDIFIREAHMGSREEFERCLEVGRDHGGGHVRPTSHRRLKTDERGIRRGAMLLQVGHPPPQCLLWSQKGSPVVPWPIFSSRTPFFCLVKTSITNVAAASSLSVAVAVLNTVRPTLKVTSDRRNGELSDFVPVYSTGRRRNKKAVMIMSATACSSL